MRLSTKPFFLFSFFALWLMAPGCFSGEQQDSQTVLVANNQGDFADYWFSGEAELNTFELSQSRYGEMRTGEAIMVFVTEDFSKSKQVKLDNSGETSNDKVPVLKLNHIRRFVTGIYDYSMMQSVFTPTDLVNHPQSLKSTTSSQDWCGQSFSQVNLDDGQYKVTSFSYFEQEGDYTTKLEADLMEDEIWNRIRIAPERIEEGNYEVIPAVFYSRLLHDPLKPKQARIRKQKNGEMTSLILEYLHLDRTLTIDYYTTFPHKIVSWTEMQNGQLLSEGRLKASIQSAYWRQQGRMHEFLRDSLGI